MKSTHYIAIAKNTHYLLSQFKLDDEFFDSLDEIRKSNARYRKEANYIALYPLHSSMGRDGYKELRPIGEQLKEECEGEGIKVFFKDIHYKNSKQFVRYVYKGVDITLIINI